ncbi:MULTISPECIES: NahK/ErcS family hybrid sensor histidine kinase/response regulator [Luteimonas]|uniref:NahK/ErcS family hybrid sensor histidine kinase/response regulator n=2 Tax=Gammaproteobacteria TaxID=1236 RepID=UPI0031B56B06
MRRRARHPPRALAVRRLSHRHLPDGAADRQRRRGAVRPRRSGGAGQFRAGAADGRERQRAGAVRLHRRLFGGDRHGHRHQRRAGDDDQQRPGDAAAAAPRLRRAPRRQRRLGRAVGAPGRDRRAGGAGLRLLPRQRFRHHAGRLRPAGLRRGRAVRTGADRRPVLARCQPDRGRGRHADRLRRLDLHAAAADADGFGLARSGLAGDRAAGHRLAAAAAAVRPRRLGRADPRHVLVAAAECRRVAAGVCALAAHARRAPARGAVPRSLCGTPHAGLRGLARQRARRRPADADRPHHRRPQRAARIRRAGAAAGPPAGAQRVGRSHLAAVHRTPARRGRRRLVGAPADDQCAERLGHGGRRGRRDARRGRPGAALQPRGAVVDAGEHRPRRQRRRPHDAAGRVEPQLPAPVRVSRQHALRRPPGRRPDPLQREIDKRIAYMRAGSPHVSERVLGNGQVVELRGQPLPGGGYATSYSDVTDYKRAERELREINETLEQRVADRTREAEVAQESRSRFLTAVSHDVLQPLNAARLFTSALRETQDGAEQKHLAERVDTSLRAAEELLDGLLDVSRLDAGALQPQIVDFDAADLLRQLAGQYAPMAAARNLEIRLHLPPTPVRSDRRLLRRVLQNFLANALRYTRSGRIVLACRRRGDTIALQVWDTGPGIPDHHMRQIYDEFHRYEQPFDWDGRGLGLGLSICQRISRLLGHTLDARATVGKGSMFSITVPRSTQPLVPTPAPSTVPDTSLSGLRVLCVDNDDDILAGMRALLQRWGVEPLCAKTIDEAIACMDAQPDVLLVDYHLHDRLDGLDTLDALRGIAPDVPGALLTADGSDALKQTARIRGYRVLTKPVKPASMRAFLAAQQRLRTAR